jgi:hypothetical protein
LKQIGTLWGWIAKIETLVLKLKNAVNFGGYIYNPPKKEKVKGKTRI